METCRDGWKRKENETAMIYSRDKHKHDFKVYKLQSGEYALIDSQKNTLYKDESMHLCKVEWIMKSMVEDGTLGMFASKLV